MEGDGVRALDDGSNGGPESSGSVVRGRWVAAVVTIGVAVAAVAAFLVLGSIEEPRRDESVVVFAVTTTTTQPITTTSEVVTKTVMVSPEANLTTSRAVVIAMSEPGGEALDGFPWFSPHGYPKKNVEDVALFEQAVHIEVTDVSCELADPQFVRCQAHATDDLSDALDGGVITVTYEFSFNDAGEITGFRSETHDGGAWETFTNWAWTIAYPAICESPAQCAAALLDVIDEYNETYPGSAIASYVEAYNNGDIDKVMAFFTEESTITGHPFNAVASGLTVIRALHVEDMAAAADTNAYSISNMHVTGNTVTWDHLWVNSLGEGYCKTGQSAVIEAGKIVSWTWPGGGFSCA